MANSSEDWMQKRWRPAMGWTYMAVCLFDFILGPVLYNILQFYNPGQAVGMWTPLTLQGAGLFHVAMGAVLGIAAWSRGQEKMAGATMAPTVPSMSPMSPPPMMSAPTMVPPMPPSLPADPSAVPKGRMKIED